MAVRYFVAFCADVDGNDEHQICLKYVPLAVTYFEAENSCRREGGALFKLDSHQKYNFFQEYLGTLKIDE